MLGVILALHYDFTIGVLITASGFFMFWAMLPQYESEVDMTDFNWCHGPQCHEKHTVDRVRGVKGSKVLRTRKIKSMNSNTFC